MYDDDIFVSHSFSLGGDEEHEKVSSSNALLPIIQQPTTLVVNRQCTAVGNPRSKDNRFSNPKKDLVTFMERKSFSSRQYVHPNMTSFFLSL